MFDKNKSFLRFETNGLDFPFYDGNPSLDVKQMAILALAVLVFTAYLFIPVDFESKYMFTAVFLCIVMIVPVGYVIKNRWGIFFKKPSLNDIVLIITCCILYYAFALAVISILMSFNIQLNASRLTTFDLDRSFLVFMLIQVLGEEFFKVIIFLLVLTVSYRLTKNRSFSVILATVATMIAFGLIHYGAYSSILQILLIQGLCGFFMFYPYLKTKNILISYLVHVLVDLIPILFLIG